MSVLDRGTMSDGGQRESLRQITPILVDHHQMPSPKRRDYTPSHLRKTTAPSRKGKLTRRAVPPLGGVDRNRSMRAAGDLIVSDRVIHVASVPQAMALSHDLMWILYDDVRCEVRNVRTAEVVKRLEPKDAAKVAEKSPSSSADRAHPLLPSAAGGGHVAENSYQSLLTGNHETKRPTLQISAILALQTCAGQPHVWLGLSDGTIEVHHAKTTELLATLHRHTGEVLCFAEFGGLVYSSGADQCVVQWHAGRPRYERTFAAAPGQRGAVWCMGAEGNALLTGSEDGAVRVWDVGSGRLLLTGHAHATGGGVTAICRVQDAVWSGDATGQVIRWRLHTCEAFDVFKPHQASVTALQRVGGRTYSGAADGTIAVFCSETATLLTRVGEHSTKRVTGIAYPAQLSRFVIWSADSRGFIRCWYQDEYIHVTRDYEYFNGGTWYLSGSTPYHEFRDSIAAHILELQEHARGKEHDTVQGQPSAIWVEGPELQKQYARLQEQIPILEERAAKETENLKKRKAEMAQLENDLKNQVNLLGIAYNELNALIPGEADRLKATLPPIPPIAMPMNANGQDVPSLVSAPTTAPNQDASPAAAALSGTAPVPLQPVAASPLTLPYSTSLGAASTALATAAPSALGVGGALQPPAPSGAPYASTLTTATTAIDGSTRAAAAPTSSTQNGIPVGADATRDKEISANALLSISPGMVDKVWNGVSWVNPNVGNYIQRRYYGAEPSLRTPDIMKRVQKKRLPEIKVFPLGRSKSAEPKSTKGNKEPLKKG